MMVDIWIGGTRQFALYALHFTLYTPYSDFSHTIYVFLNINKSGPEGIDWGKYQVEEIVCRV